MNERDIKENFANDFENVTKRVNLEDYVEDSRSSDLSDIITHLTETIVEKKYLRLQGKQKQKMVL